MKEEKKTGKTEAKKTRKLEVWHETVGKEKITIVKTGDTTTRIHREKLHDAMQKIIKDPAMRAKLEANPADAMAKMGIELDDKEKSALAGRRLSEILGLLSKPEMGARGAVGFFPESIIDVVVNTISSGPETVTATVSGAITEGGNLVATETAAEEAVVVIAVTL